MIKLGLVVFAAGVCVFLAVLIQSQSAQDERSRQAAERHNKSDEEADFDPERVVPGFAALSDPSVVPASDVVGLNDDELVIGLEIGGQTRAYPVNFISEPAQEIVNDVLAGVPVAVTWCSHCNNGMVFERRVDGKPITLRVAGLLWRDNMVMVDEIGTQWSQLLGEAMRGPRKGKSLRSIPVALTSWKSWKRRHPATTVVDLKRTSEEYRRDFLAAHDDLYFGISRLAEPRAWKLAAVSKAVVVNDWIYRGGNSARTRVPVVVAYLPGDGTVVIRERRLENRVLTFEMNGRHEIVDRKTGSVWDLLSGNATSGALAGKTLPLLPGTLVRGTAWKKFRPGSSYWKPASDAARD